jgi:type II secretion system protein I
VASTNSKGFTFIEVLVAMLIFVLAVLAAINIVHGAVRATNDAKTLTVATWLLQNVMVELETKIETLGVDRGCDKKKEAKFDPPYQNFSWVAYCYEVNMNISSTASQMLNKKDGDSDNRTQVNLVQNLIFQIASEYLTKAMRELHVEVIWMQGKTKRTVDATTHFANLDYPLTVPAIGIGGTQ